MFMVMCVPLRKFIFYFWCSEMGAQIEEANSLLRQMLTTHTHHADSKIYDYRDVSLLIGEHFDYVLNRIRWMSEN